jgi:SAM-dependent methyltransferase
VRCLPKAQAVSRNFSVPTNRSTATMDHSEDLAATARFFDRAIHELGRLARAQHVRVLDFGCGSGQLVEELVARGYDAHGCDIAVAPEAPSIARAPERFKQVAVAPYRLPYDDESFDVVVSTSVLEHARNPEEYLVEIRRVLKPGGMAMHLVPGKWYLPFEPHVRVPFANYFYPNCPTWWFALWMLVGKRHPHHKELSWREAVSACREFYDNRVFYLSSREHERLSRAVFGNCEWPMTFYLTHAHGCSPASAASCRCGDYWGCCRVNAAWAFSCKGSSPRPRLISERRVVVTRHSPDRQPMTAGALRPRGR